MAADGAFVYTGIDVAWRTRDVERAMMTGRVNSTLTLIDACIDPDEAVRSASRKDDAR
jgi:hypothetical protein